MTRVGKVPYEFVLQQRETIQQTWKSAVRKTCAISRLDGFASSKPSSLVVCAVPCPPELVKMKLDLQN